MLLRREFVDDSNSLSLSRAPVPLLLLLKTFLLKPELKYAKLFFHGFKGKQISMVELACQHLEHERPSENDWVTGLGKSAMREFMVLHKCKYSIHM